MLIELVDSDKQKVGFIMLNRSELYSVRKTTFQLSDLCNVST